MNKVLAYLNQVLHPGDKVVVAVSAGPDSMALLNILSNLKIEKQLEIICAHVNHNKRVESEAEKELVETYCQKNNITFEYIKFDKYDKGNFQEIARKKRYSFFETVLKKHHAHLLMTAHHGDDLAETILMRIARGSTLKGYAGFSKMTSNNWYTLIRPLVYTTKDEIIKYLEQNHVSYATDRSNLEDNYTRNRYRHHILTELKKEEPNITAKFLRFSEKIDETANYINEIIQEKMAIIYIDSTLNIVKFNYEKDYLKKMIIKKILEDLYVDNVVYLKEKHIDIILDLIENSRPNIEAVLPNQVRVIKRYDKLIFTTEIEQQDKYRYLLDEKMVINNHKIEEITETIEDSNDICRLSIRDIQLPLYVRNRQKGDRIAVKGLNGTKKIKEIFIEKKIAKVERDTWPIVVDSNDRILWIPGLKKSKYNKQKDEKCDIILKYN